MRAKGETVMLKLTPEEAVLLEKLSRSTGITTRSGLIRYCLVQQAKALGVRS